MPGGVSLAFIYSFIILIFKIFVFPQLTARLTRSLQVTALACGTKAAFSVQGFHLQEFDPPSPKIFRKKFWKVLNSKISIYDILSTALSH